MLYLMCGIPGSGKTTWLINYTTKRDSVVSRDAIRFAMLGNPDKEYFSSEEEVIKRFRNSIENDLALYENVYADATHLTPKSRRRVMDWFKDEGVRFGAIWFDIPVEVAIERNAERDGLAFVPEDVIRSMSKVFTPPQESEGFEEIIRVGA